MLKSKTIRSITLILASFFLFACLGSAGSSGTVTQIANAVTETASAVTQVPTIELLTRTPDQIAAGPQEQPEQQEDGPYLAQMPVISSTTPKQTNCRYGIGNEPGQEAKEWLDVVGAGHYINFISQEINEPSPDTVEYYRQVRIAQDKEDGEYLPSYSIKPPLHMNPGGLGERILDNPGALWIVGNEPDVANPAQDDTYPEWYARAYHEAYYFIKEVDPHASVAIAGLSMMTPGRLQYLDIVWDTYVSEFGEPMPVDVWNMHLYILSEIRPWDNGMSDGKIALGTDPALAIKAPEGDPAIECPKEDVYCRAEHDDLGIFADQVMAMRTFMKEHGQQDKPLMISEFSQLYPFVDYDDAVNPTECFLMDEFGQCFTPHRVSTFLQGTMDYLENAKDPDLGYPADGNRLVQQWTWYSLWVDSEHSGASSNLLIDGYEALPAGSEDALTEVGQNYWERAYNSPQTVNLLAGDTPDVEASIGSAEETADVTLEVGVSNNGSSYLLQSFNVTFYADEDLTEVIGETSISPGLTGGVNGCSWGRVRDWATVTWENVPEGVHSFWVKVDSQDHVSGESNESDNVSMGQVTVAVAP